MQRIESDNQRGPTPDIDWIPDLENPWGLSDVELEEFAKYTQAILERQEIEKIANEYLR